MKTDHVFPNGQVVEMDTLKTCDWLGLHRPLSELEAGKSKSYVITHRPTHAVVCQFRTKTECTMARKALVDADWSNRAALGKLVHDLLVRVPEAYATKQKEAKARKAARDSS